MNGATSAPTASSPSTQSQSQAPKFKRVLLKITGEGFAPPGSSGVALDNVETIGRQIAETAETGVEIAVVVGGGNILRGSRFAGDARIQEATAHYMGMLGTVINALALQDVLERKFGFDTRVQTAIEIAKVAEPFLRRRAINHLRQKRIVILAAGLGSPFFTTDTCAAQRASELGCDVLLKGTKVDGVYTADPNKDPTAQRYDRVSYTEFMTRNLKVMDQTAIAFCREHDLPIIVFNLNKAGAVRRVVMGEPVGTWITTEAACAAAAANAANGANGANAPAANGNAANSAGSAVMAGR
jgi:uridylate kinase